MSVARLWLMHGPLIAVLACRPPADSSSRSRLAAGDAPADAPARTATLPDSLLLTLGSGATVWWTTGREVQGDEDTVCLERAIEIRVDTTRRLVPLLYTRTAPIALSDSVFRAELSTRCHPGGMYRVHVRTAHPEPIG